MSLQSRAAVLFRHQWLKGCIMWGGSLRGIRCIGGVRGVRRYNRHRRYIMEHRGSGQISCRHWTTATGIIERRNDFSREQPYPRRAALLTTLGAWGIRARPESWSPDNVLILFIYVSALYRLQLFTDFLQILHKHFSLLDISHSLCYVTHTLWGYELAQTCYGC